MINRNTIIAAVLMVTTAGNAHCVGLEALTKVAQDFAQHPQGRDVLTGIANGPVSRLVGRAIYQNVAGANQNHALLTVAGLIGLGTCARYVNDTKTFDSNPFLVLAVSFASAAATLQWWPIATKSEKAEAISDTDTERDAKRERGGAVFFKH